jgi:hypothetical protein
VLAAGQEQTASIRTNCAHDIPYVTKITHVVGGRLPGLCPYSSERSTTTYSANAKRVLYYVLSSSQLYVYRSGVLACRPLLGHMCVCSALALGCVYLAAAGKIWPMGCHTYVLRTVLVVLSLLVGRSAWALCFVLCASLVSTYVPTGVLDTSLTPG